jgi:dihydromethanopterin reductase (acceptor)
MNKSRLAWAITGSGHYIEECLDFLLTLDDADLFLSQTMEEAIKMYGFNVNDISEEMPVYRDEAASSSRVGNFYNGNFHAFAMASMTSNMAAKRVLGIAGSLMANL